MKNLTAKALTILCLFCASGSFAQTFSTSKPWTYWWWMGSAVNRTDIRKQLEEFAVAGIGGVHIIPIYGVKGYENQFLPFLGNQWMEMVEFTITQAAELNLGVDMTLGTGWPYGGRWVEKEDAAKRLIPGQDSSAAGWKFEGYSIANTNQKVKRAAPGGEGMVIDFFDQKAVLKYLNHFDSIFTESKFKIKPRSWYHDSYEAYQSNFSFRFNKRFKEIKGYELTPALPVMMDTGNPARPLILHDFRETLADLLYTEFATTWTNWSRSQGISTRYQAHGSPGNLLDLYALADIPETESFGCSNFSIPKLSCDPDYEEERFGRPSPLMMKFASSPAHLLNKPLVSSETGTWLANHFKVSLSQIKPQIDELFVSGINHIFYHGITYSPEKENYPGWLFYASTNFGQSSHFWDELPLLNSYITECQTILQNSTPDNDILLYFPIDDLWTKYPGDPLLMLDVHKYSEWFGKTEFGNISGLLWNNGFTFDYISDKQISQLQVKQDGQLTVNLKSSWSVIVIPPLEYPNKKTLQILDSLAQKGAKIIFAGHSGNSENLIKDLKLNKIRNEEIKLKGLDFIRKRTDNGSVYFITNLSSTYNSDSIRLTSKSNYFELFDPQSLKKGFIETSDRILLQLPPGKSVFIKTLSEKPVSVPWQYFNSSNTIDLRNNWTVSFLSGNTQNLKPDYKMDRLTSWTDWGDENLKSFCGKAKYVSEFAIPGFDESQIYQLEFDQIHETAAITINGTACGTIWSLPWSLQIPEGVLKEQNTIEIIVQNLSANKIRKIDRQKIPWKKFYDTNFVDIRYNPFDASNWADAASGITGRVILIRSRQAQHSVH